MRLAIVFEHKNGGEAAEQAHAADSPPLRFGERLMRDVGRQQNRSHLHGHHMRVGGWYRLGIVVSASWILVTLWAYFYELSNHPSKLAFLIPHASYEWVNDPDATRKAHANAQARGQDFASQWVFMKPTFSAYGFLKFTLAPVAAGWIGAHLAFWIVRWVKKGFEN